MDEELLQRTPKSSIALKARELHFDGTHCFTLSKTFPLVLSSLYKAEFCEHAIGCKVFGEVARCKLSKPRSSESVLNDSRTCFRGKAVAPANNRVQLHRLEPPAPIQ